MTTRVAAIHQPNFFPWLGYFAKIAAADVFVFLDAVAMPYPRGSWVNRVRLRIAGEARWVTCPVVRRAGEEIRHVAIDDRTVPWRRKLLGSLETNYHPAAHYEALFPWVAGLVSREEARLAEYNVANITAIARRLGIDTPFVRQSELQRPEVFAAKGSERLAWICREVGADVYLAGDGADDYEDLAAYERMGIGHRRLGFRHPVYDQHAAGGEFLPGLSVLDALLCAGVEGTAALAGSAAGSLGAPGAGPT